jgi:hypothetical protein
MVMETTIALPTDIQCPLHRHTSLYARVASVACASKPK